MTNLLKTKKSDLVNGFANKSDSENKVCRLLSSNGEFFKFLVKSKYRFDAGAAFIGYINFILLIIAVSGKLTTWIPLSTKQWLLILVPAGILGIWLCGYILDKTKVLEQYNVELNDRNGMMNEILAELKKLNEKSNTSTDYSQFVDIGRLD